jgi:hypothetical protein
MNLTPPVPPEPPSPERPLSSKPKVINCGTWEILSEPGDFCENLLSILFVIVTQDISKTGAKIHINPFFMHSSGEHKYIIELNNCPFLNT